MNLTNRFVKTKERSKIDSSELIATAIVGFERDYVFDRYLSVEKDLNDKITFNEIDGIYNKSIIKEVLHEYSGYCENQTIRKREFSNEPLPNYFIKTDGINHVLCQIYINKNNFNISLFEKLKFNRRSKWT